MAQRGSAARVARLPGALPLAGGAPGPCSLVLPQVQAVARGQLVGEGIGVRRLKSNTRRGTGSVGG